jgi:hypothetical protein
VIPHELRQAYDGRRLVSGLGGRIQKRRRARGLPVQISTPPIEITVPVDRFEQALARVKERLRREAEGNGNGAADQCANFTLIPAPRPPPEERVSCPCEVVGRHPPRLCPVCLDFLLRWIEASVYNGAMRGQREQARHQPRP